MFIQKKYSSDNIQNHEKEYNQTHFI
jgi:hypothetical protein